MSSDFYVNTHPTARKPHRCMMCRRSIDPGEQYRRGAGMDGSTAWTWIECAHCSALAGYLTSQDDYYDDGYDWTMLADWEPASVEHLRIKALAVRRQWRRTDGTLYPVPVIERDLAHHACLHLAASR